MRRRAAIDKGPRIRHGRGLIGEDLKPLPTDALWTWPKIAIVVGAILAMLTLLLMDR